MKLKATTTPVVRNALTPLPLWRRVLFTVSAVALVGSAVALQPVAHAGTATTPTPTPRPQFQLLATIPLKANTFGTVTLNRALNKIYTGGHPPVDQHIEVIDGVTFAKAEVGIGDGASVDNKTQRYWAASFDESSVIVRDGTTNGIIATVPIPGGFCPIHTNYDFFNNRVWTGARCSDGNDPIFAIDATSFEIIAGTPVSSGGEIRGIISNGANGRVYFADREGQSLISKRIDPTTFAVTLNAFGIVKAINALTNTLYAVPFASKDLQIVDGRPDPEIIVKTVRLGYSPNGLGVNTAFNYLYLSNSNTQSIEVRNGSTGDLITTFSFAGTELKPENMAVDSSRSRIYAIQNFQNSPSKLLVIEDLIATFGPDSILSH
jgi:DNA-binding beta-propeller fold protein YncE